MFYNIDEYDIASHADGTTPYTSYFNPEEVIEKLELVNNNLFKWFKINNMKANAGKCHLLYTRENNTRM